MRELVWLNSAVEDLVRLRAFLAAKNPNAAKRAAEAINEMTQRLVVNPLLGKPVNDLPEYRDILIRFGAGGYVLRYRIHLGTVYAVHLRHYRETDFKI